MRTAQKQVHGEEQKSKQLQDKITKAEAKGEDATQFQVQLAANKAGAIRDCLIIDYPVHN